MVYLTVALCIITDECITAKLNSIYAAKVKLNFHETYCNDIIMVHYGTHDNNCFYKQKCTYLNSCNVPVLLHNKVTSRTVKYVSLHSSMLLVVPFLVALHKCANNCNCHTIVI
jgi:hypothetical protein